MWPKGPLQLITIRNSTLEPPALYTQLASAASSPTTLTHTMSPLMSSTRCATPDILSHILPHLDKSFLPTAMRVNSVFFGVAASLLYRELSLSDVDTSDAPTLFLGRRDEESMPWWSSRSSTSSRVSKRLYLQMTRRLFIMPGSRPLEDAFPGLRSFVPTILNVAEIRLAVDPYEHDDIEVYTMLHDYCSLIPSPPAPPARIIAAHFNLICPITLVSDDENVSDTASNGESLFFRTESESFRMVPVTIKCRYDTSTHRVSLIGVLSLEGIQEEREDVLRSIPASFVEMLELGDELGLKWVPIAIASFLAQYGVPGGTTDLPVSGVEQRTRPLVVHLEIAVQPHGPGGRGLLEWEDLWETALEQGFERKLFIVNNE